MTILRVADTEIKITLNKADYQYKTCRFALGNDSDNKPSLCFIQMNSMDDTNCLAECINILLSFNHMSDAEDKLNFKVGLYYQDVIMLYGNIFHALSLLSEKLIKNGINFFKELLQQKDLEIFWDGTKKTILPIGSHPIFLNELEICNFTEKKQNMNSFFGEEKVALININQKQEVISKCCDIINKLPNQSILEVILEIAKKFNLSPQQIKITPEP
jgi:hypothetical protein